MSEQHDPITKSEAESLAEDAATKAARQVLKEIGIDADQEWKEHQKDMEYLRQMRHGSEQVRLWGRRTGIGAIVSAVLWILWEGFKVYIKSKGGQ